MKILGRKYTGDALHIPIPLDVERSVIEGLTTRGQKVSALYWLEFWHDAVGRAIRINRTNGKPTDELKTVESDYAWIIENLKEGLGRT